MNDQPGQCDEGYGDYRVLSDREEIRTWAEDKGIVPARREDTGGTGRTELVHRDDLRDDHEERDWNTFHREMADRNLVVVHEVGGSRGRFQLVDRDDPDERGDLDDLDDEVATELPEDDAGTAEATEREVVEETTIEIELVGSDVVRSEIVESEVVRKELVGVAVAERPNAAVEGGERASAAFGDGERTYLEDDRGHVVGIAESGVVGLDIDVRRTETEEQVVEHVVESRVVEEASRESNVREESVVAGLDPGNVHEHIASSGVLDVVSDGPIEDRYIETEFDEGNVARSTVAEHRTVEDEVTERRVVYATVEDVETEDSELVNEAVVENQVVEPDRSEYADRIGTGTPWTGATDDPPVAGGDFGHDRVTERLMGRDVELPDGEAIGIVSDVDPERDRIHLDEDPSLADRIRASINWSDEGDGPVLSSDRILEVDREVVVVERDENPS